MEIWLWVTIGILLAAVLLLLLKIYTLHNAAKEIGVAFADRLITDTNTLIDISSSDRYMRRLADDINTQLRKLRAERHRFQRGDLEVKNAVTNISHDLRTPLTAICGYLDLLENEEMPEKAARYIDVIRNRADLLTRLTEELFRYSVATSKDDPAPKVPVSVKDVLEESIAAYYAALSERHITPNITMPEEKVVRILDRSALTRVFSNLISNAVRYSDGDLDITLSDAGEITFTNRASCLDEVQTGKLFDRFYTVDAARRSTGLGLAIARSLIRRMNGTITAQYENSRLSIRIFLPEDEVKKTAAGEAKTQN